MYEYEKDPPPNIDQLKLDLNEAKQKMMDRAKKIQLTPDMNVNIFVKDQAIPVISVTDSKGTLDCRLDTRMLRRILDRNAYWNNAEIGCHIEIERKPNHYSPDMHLMLQFLHL